MKLGNLFGRAGTPAASQVAEQAVRSRALQMPIAQPSANHTLAHRVRNYVSAADQTGLWMYDGIARHMRQNPLLFLGAMPGETITPLSRRGLISTAHAAIATASNGHWYGDVDSELHVAYNLCLRDPSDASLTSYCDHLADLYMASALEFVQGNAEELRPFVDGGWERVSQGFQVNESQGTRVVRWGPFDPDNHTPVDSLFAAFLQSTERVELARGQHATPLVRVFGLSYQAHEMLRGIDLPPAYYDGLYESAGGVSRAIRSWSNPHVLEDSVLRIVQGLADPEGHVELSPQQFRSRVARWAAEEVIALEDASLKRARSLGVAPLAPSQMWKIFDAYVHLAPYVLDPINFEQRRQDLVHPRRDEVWHAWYRTSGLQLITLAGRDAALPQLPSIIRRVAAVNTQLESGRFFELRNRLDRLWSDWGEVWTDPRTASVQTHAIRHAMLQNLYARAKVGDQAIEAAFDQLGTLPLSAAQGLLIDRVVGLAGFDLDERSFARELGRSFDDLQRGINAWVPSSVDEVMHVLRQGGYRYTQSNLLGLVQGVQSLDGSSFNEALHPVGVLIQQSHRAGDSMQQLQDRIDTAYPQLARERLQTDRARLAALRDRLQGSLAPQLRTYIGDSAAADAERMQSLRLVYERVIAADQITPVFDQLAIVPPGVARELLTAHGAPIVEGAADVEALAAATQSSFTALQDAVRKWKPSTLDELVHVVQGVYTDIPRQQIETYVGRMQAADQGEEGVAVQRFYEMSVLAFSGGNHTADALQTFIDPLVARFEAERQRAAAAPTTT